MGGFEVLTLNVWNTQPPLSERMDRLLEFLKSRQPDIAALQEVSPIESVPQSELLAQEAGYNVHHYCPAGEWEGREEGLAILSQAESTLVGAMGLPRGNGKMERILQLVKISLPGEQQILLGNTHLSFEPGAVDLRFRQADRIYSEFLEQTQLEAERRFVLCGDFNDTVESKALRRFTGSGSLVFTDSWNAVRDGPGITFDSENSWARQDLLPGRRIDYVLVSGLDVLDCELVFREDGPWGRVSDHYGVLARVGV